MQSKRKSSYRESETTVMKFSLSAAECFDKGWVKPSDEISKNVYEIISAFQTSVNECLRIFRKHATDIEQKPPEDYVVWRYGDSRRIVAANYMKFLQKSNKMSPQLSLFEFKPLHRDDDEGGVEKMHLDIQSSAVLNASPTSLPIPTTKTLNFELPGTNSKLTKLLDGAWATHIQQLRICTKSGPDCVYYPNGQLAMLTCSDVKSNVTNCFIYDDAKKNVVLFAAALPREMTCYKRNGAIWFHVNRDGGIYYDYGINQLKTWVKTPPWNVTNYLELQLNKYFILRFKGMFKISIFYRYAMDNLNVKITFQEKSSDVLAQSDQYLAGKPRPSSSLRQNMPAKQDLVTDDMYRSVYNLNKYWKVLKLFQVQVNQIVKQMDKRLSAFFTTPPYAHYKVKQLGKPKDESPWDARKSIYTWTLDADYPAQDVKKDAVIAPVEIKQKDSVICPLVLRQQILHQQMRKTAASVHGFDIASTSTNKMWLSCICSNLEMPVVTDVEFQEYITKRSPSRQMLIICITSNKSNPSKIQSMLNEMYCSQATKHRKPCTQLPLDSYRLLNYDLSSAISGTTRTVPWLIEQHKVVPEMVMMYLNKKLLFCDFKFNGYGTDYGNFISQIQRCFELSQLGLHLPADFKFGSSFEQPNLKQEAVIVQSLYSLREIYNISDIVEEN